VQSGKIIGILLAGGLGRRLGGGDKPLKKLGGIPLLAHAARALQPQCQSLIVSANGDLERFSKFGLPVVADDLRGAGPLAGILASLEWIAAHDPDAPLAMSAPADTPFLPDDLVARLEGARQGGAAIACASSGGRLHPAVALWPVALRGALRRAMVEGNVRKVETFERNCGAAIADWPATPYDPFFNVNDPQDLLTAEEILLSREEAAS
jgi:molybdenum cofactor guanylyltransferase